MDYARFVRLRRPVWEAFEAQLAGVSGSRGSRGRLRQGGYATLEDMALRYRQVLHDHALAAARFPGTAAARRLQALALAGTRQLTGEGRQRSGGLRTFFALTFPRAFRRQLGLLGIAVALFLVAAVWGLTVAALRPAIGFAFLGPEALRGLEEGRLWTNSLVSTLPPAVSSSGIATNNLSVALTAWSGGVLAGLVPLYVVLLNGLMLGAILGVTLHYSMAGELLEFISAHGLLELTLILVSASAGLSLGRALVAAGDRPRALAMREAGRDSLAVLLGCLPWFVVLALVEVFVSPSPEVPAVVKLTLGLALEGAFLSLALRPYQQEPAQEASPEPT
ncbi:MAG TPA: stage II sporulation protein M [Thermoanaerobaculia bacterium]|nr:stage II sporulation protein M [Thermoanaerobaculia bacterium]